MQAGRTLAFAAAFAGTWLAAFAAERTVTSPDGSIVFRVDAEGRPYYSVSFDGREAIGRSALGFAFADEAPMAGGFAAVWEAEGK